MCIAGPQLAESGAARHCHLSRTACGVTLQFLLHTKRHACQAASAASDTGACLSRIQSIFHIAYLRGLFHETNFKDISLESLESEIAAPSELINYSSCMLQQDSTVAWHFQLLTLLLVQRIQACT